MSTLYNQPKPLWQSALTAIAAFLLSIGASAPAHAIPQEYTIVAMGVDTSRQKASNYAMDYAKKRALFMAAKRLGVVDPEKAIMALKPEVLAQVIRGTTVTKTQRVGEKTYQEIKVTIADEPLKAALGVKGDAAPAAPAGRNHSVLVVPVLVTPQKTWVWEKENTLRAPLSDELLRQAHGLVMLPSGDLEDLRLIDRENAHHLKLDELKPMFERYGVQEVVVASIAVGAAGSEDPTKILLHRVAANNPRDEVIELKPETAEDTTDMRILAAARAIAAATTQIASSTAEDEQDKLAKAAKLPVKFVYTTPKDLAKLTETIRTAPKVLQLELPTIMLNNVSGVIYLEGDDKDALRKYLAAKAIIIRDMGDHWTASAR